jgi:inhibitor of cysteine peptidase
MSGTHDALHVDQSFDTREVVLHPRQMLTLSLGENPTTGFRWELGETGAPACVLRDSSFDAPAGGLGNGGTRRWLFEAVEGGTGRIRLVYRRAWEDKPPARTFGLTVRVEP